MGRKGSTKRFIAKGEGQQKFFLVHRSQTDNAYATEERPSEFVLIKAGGGQNGVGRKDVDDVAENTGTTNLPLNSNHITELGFKNDGYDYSQHLKVMGGGRFIGKSGVSYDLPSHPATLPADSLPSEFEFDRQLNAITISHEYMDEDIRQALFEDNDDGDGQFEVLSDNFVMEAMEAPEEPDFDFDKHIANLIANSERSLGSNVAPRGWGDSNSNNNKLKSVSNKFHHHDDDDEEVESYEDGYDDDDDDQCKEGQKTVPQSSTEHQAFLEEQLARTLEEYDDDEIGSLEDREEEIAGGTLDDDGSDLAFTKLLDDFLMDNADRAMVEGVKLTKGSRVTPLFALESEKERAPMTPAENIASLLGDDTNNTTKEDTELGEDLLMCQEYLRETRIESEWDCETILTTYSTLENHPTIISAPKKNNNRKMKNNGTDDHQSVSSNFSNNNYTGKYHHKNSPYFSTANATTNANKIELTGKLMLPKGFISNPKSTTTSTITTTTTGSANHVPVSVAAPVTQSRSRLNEKVIPFNQESKSNSTLTAPVLVPAVSVPVSVPAVSVPVATRHESELINSDSESCSEAEDNNDLLDEQGGNKPLTRRNETAEERKIRKNKVKEERRLKRASKKHLKQAYRQEGMRVTKTTLTSESGNVDVHTSVFKY